MNNDEIVDVLINLVEDAGGFLFIQSGTLAERPQSQSVGNLFIDMTTRIIYRFDGKNWGYLPSSSGLLGLSVTKEVTETTETTIPGNSSSVVRSTSPF